MSLNEEDIKHLGDRIGRYSTDVENLTIEVKENRQATEEVRSAQVAIRKTQKMQTYLLLGKSITIVLIVVLMVLVLRDQSQTSQTAKQTNVIAQAIQSCTTPSGACRQRDNAVVSLVENLTPLKVEQRRLADVIQTNQDQNNLSAVAANQKAKESIDKEIAELQAQLDALIGNS